MATLNRRAFIGVSLGSACLPLIARVSHAQDPVLSSDDPTAMALGYYADHTSVDTQKWTKKAGADGAGQQCTSCALFQKLDDEYGNCPIFPGKRVHSSGWCSSWVAG